MCENSCEKRENFEEIKQRLLRHLSTSGDIKELSNKFGVLRGNFERVNFVSKLLDESGIDVGFIEDRKDDEIAVKLRERGNEMYKVKKLKEAWEFYNKSLSYAEGSGVNLALAYANRSAVLFEVNLHEQCLRDIGRALEGNYPDHLKPKLFVREKNSRNLEISAFQNPHQSLPLLSTSNSNIQSASNGVEVQEKEQMGRHIVASRNIEIGEVLAVEKPFASLIVDQYLSHCHECLNLCYNLIPCQHCTQTMYCSDICREKAWTSYHQHECPILATLRAMQLDKLKMLPLKIALLVKKEYSELNRYQDGGMYRSDCYREVHSLIANTAKRSVGDLFERATAAAVISKLVKDHTDFFSDEDVEDVFKEILLLHMQTGPSNFHEITELAPNSEGVFVSEEVGSGAFAFLSLLNHSCTPNVTRFCYGDTIVLRAIHSIKKGEQIFDNYGYHYAVTEKPERQRRLKKQYYFDCCCKACKGDWPTYDGLIEVEKAEVDESLMAKLASADVVFAEKVLHSSLEKLGDLEEFVPCRNVCQMQEIVKQCFAIFGNKRRIF